MLQIDNQKTNPPHIYTLADCPVMGTFGEATIKNYGDKKCETCGKVEKDSLEYLDYRLDGWDGEELMKVAQSYVVSKRLGMAIEKTGLKGCSFKEMTISRADSFEEASPPDVKVPIFYQLIINGKAAGPNVWFEFKGECPTCGRYKLKMTEAYLDGLVADGSAEPGPPREVSKKCWQGDDFFMHTKDPGPPIVTQKVVDLFKKLSVKGVAFNPVKWVD